MPKTSFIATKSEPTRQVEKVEQAPKPIEAPKPKSKTMLYAIIIIVLIVVGVGVYYLTRPPTQTVGEQLTIWDTSSPSPGTCLQAASPPDCGFKDSSGNSNVTLTVGTLVQWTNNGGAVHTVYSCDSAHVQTLGCPNGANSVNLAFTSPTINPNGGTFQFAFSQAGKFAYYCSIHPWMHGTVIGK